MKVIVIGGAADSLEVVRALRKISNKGGVEIVDYSEIENNGDLELAQSEPLTEVQMLKVFNYLKPKPNNQWRGGSRGKGVKTKWPRR